MNEIQKSHSKAQQNKCINIHPMNCRKKGIETATKKDFT